MKSALTSLRFSCRLRCALYLALLAVLIASPPAAAQSPAPVETGFINAQVTDGVRKMVYVVYVPRDYVPDKQWPVILCLAGAFTSGADGFRPLFITLPPKGPYSFPNSLIWGGSFGGAVTRNPQRFPCLVVWPQMPRGNDLTGWSGPFEALALQALEEVVTQYNGDRNRLYLTGDSLGGLGTWMVAANHPDLFAAAMPIAGSLCGTSQEMAIAMKLKSLPLWVFCGEKDSGWPVSCTRAQVKAILAAGNTNIQYTEYPGAEHPVWDIAWNDPQVIAWLLAQKR
jgi:predicted peptidase